MILPDPPGPKGLVRNLRDGLRASKDVIGYTSRLAREHGDLVRIPIGPFSAYQVTDPGCAHQLLGRLSESFAKPARLRRVFRPWLGNGLLFSEGVAWRRQRKWMESALKGVTPETLVKPSIDSMLAEVDKHLGTCVDIADVCERVAFLGLLKTVFGEVDQTEAEQAFLDATTLQNDGVRRMKSLVMPRWIPTAHNRRFHQAMDQFRDFVHEQLERCRRQRGDNLASRMLDAADNHEISTDELFHGATNILFGGKAGVASLTWTAYALSRNPAVQGKVLAELDAVCDGLPGFQHAEELSYMNLTIKESFRFYPPVPMVTRQPLASVDLEGYRIRRNSFIYIAIVLMHRDGRWFADPEEFRPERWVSPDAQMRAAYMPFGLGPHVCVGRPIAMLQVPLAMAALLSRCELQWPDGEPEPKFEVDERLHPASALRLNLVAR